MVKQNLEQKKKNNINLLMTNTMVKTFKEYLSTVTIGGLGLIRPMAALSRKGTDLGPKNGRARGVGTLVASTQKDKKKKK